MSIPIYYYDIEQGTDEWLSARLGIVTASEINNLVTPKGKPCTGAKVQAYACLKASERVTNHIEEHFESWDMQRGHIQEEIAREIYSENYEPVTECGFITRKINGVKIGASPDGLIEDDSGLEIKSRLAKFQVETVIADEVPDIYMNQIQATLMISNRKSWEFAQYSNGMPLFVKRVLPDPVRQEIILNAIMEFEKLVLEMVEKFKAGSKDLIQTERVDLSFDDDEIKESEEEK
jgi:hypothetical protein